MVREKDLKEIEHIDFLNADKGVDSIRIRLPYHHIHHAIEYGHIKFTKKGFRFSDEYKLLHSRFNQLFWKIHKTSKIKTLMLDEEWMEEFGLSYLGDEFNVQTIEAHFESQGRTWKTSDGRTRKESPAPYLRLVISPDLDDSYEYAYRIVLDKVISIIAEFSLHKYLTRDPLNLDKNQPYSVGLREITKEMREILLWFVETRLNFDGFFAGFPLLGRIDIMSDIELDNQKELYDFLRVMHRISFNDYQQISYVEGYTVKFNPSLRGDNLRIYRYFVDGEVRVGLRGPKSHKLPKIQYYNKSEEIFKFHSVRPDGIFLRGEQQFHSGNDVMNTDVYLRLIKKSIREYMEDVVELMKFMQSSYKPFALVRLEDCFSMLYNNYDLAARARSALLEALSRNKKKRESLKERIVDYLLTHKLSTSSQLRDFFNLSRNTLYHHLKELREEGKVVLKSRRYWGLSDSYLSELSLRGVC